MKLREVDKVWNVYSLSYGEMFCKFEMLKFGMKLIFYKVCCFKINCLSGFF